MTPGAKRWKEICDTVGPISWNQWFELFVKLSTHFECGRCGRSDLPLYLYQEHNRSCSYECALGEPAIETVERLKGLLEESLDVLEEYPANRIMRLEDTEPLRRKIRLELGMGPAPSVKIVPYSFFVCQTCSGKFETKFARYTSVRENAEVHCEWCARHRKA